MTAVSLSLHLRSSFLSRNFKSSPLQLSFQAPRGLSLLSLCRFWNISDHVWINSLNRALSINRYTFIWEYGFVVCCLTSYTAQHCRVALLQDSDIDQQYFPFLKASKFRGLANEQDRRLMVSCCRRIAHFIPRCRVESC